jgi:hypothetical protein
MRLGSGSDRKVDGVMTAAETVGTNSKTKCSAITMEAQHIHEPQSSPHVGVGADWLRFASVGESARLVGTGASPIQE